MKELDVRARAKINISLDVLRKRPDGYHDVKMIMQTIDLYDQLRFKKIEEDTIQIKTNLPFLPTDERNLVYKVIRHMKNAYQIQSGVQAHIYKMIPVAAGLAGGSADAGETIKAMNKLFDLKLSMDEMLAIGKQFGADIPYCMIGGTALAEGIGEQITFLDDFPECYVVLVKPNFGVSTAHVYGNLKVDALTEHPETDTLIQAISVKDLTTIGQHLCNVLESVTAPQYPEIQEIKDELVRGGAIGALMSGSGPSVYGLFENLEAAKESANQLKNKGLAKFVRVTTIYNRKRV